MKKERPLEYTGMPALGGTAILRLSLDGKTRNTIATVDDEHYEVVLKAIKKHDGFSDDANA